MTWDARRRALERELAGDPEDPRRLAEARRTLERCGLARIGETDGRLIIELAPRLRPGVGMASLRGHLNSRGCEALDELAARWRADGVRLGLLDIVALRSLASSGFNHLARLGDALQQAGGGLALLRPSNKVRVVTEMLGLHSLFELAEDSAGALRQLERLRDLERPRLPAIRVGEADGAPPRWGLEVQGEGEERCAVLRLEAPELTVPDPLRPCLLCVRAPFRGPHGRALVPPPREARTFAQLEAALLRLTRTRLDARLVAQVTTRLGREWLLYIPKDAEARAGAVVEAAACAFRGLAVSWEAGEDAGWSRYAGLRSGAS